MNKEVFLQGKCKWCRSHKTDTYGNWKIMLYPNEASLAEIRKLKEEGLKNHLNKDEDGYHMYFTRPSQKTIKGKVVAFHPPELFHADGTTPLKDVYVGNGSDVTIKVEVYKYIAPRGEKGVAARWSSARVDNLVPFEVKRDFTKEQQESIAGLEKQPEQKEISF